VKETFLPNPKGREPKLKLKLNNNNLEPPHHKRNHKFAFDIIYRGSQLPIAGKYIHSRKQRDIYNTKCATEHIQEYQTLSINTSREKQKRPCRQG
jgi:hypothetical protein